MASPSYRSAGQMIPTGSWFGVVVKDAKPDATVGVGRVIGDGGWYFHIADMAVHPQHQRKGLADAILAALLTEIETKAPPEPHQSGRGRSGTTAL